MRVLYIVTKLESMRQVESGALKKIEAQIKSLRKQGIDCDISACGVPAEYSFFQKLMLRLPYFTDSVKWNDVKIEQYDAIYIRRPLYISRDLVSWAKKAKLLKPELKILLEIQTYPYDLEYSKLHQKPFLWKDRWNRRMLTSCVDRIVDLTGSMEIFGVPTLPFFNGIDLDLEAVRKPQMNSNNAMNVLIIAVFAFWHGIDRILEGIAKYRSQPGFRPIVLHLVGDGPALNELKRHAERLGLGDDVVIFHGRMAPHDFDPLYNQCDLAVECLGNHRKGITTSSSLKSREYLAKGVPFVYSGEIDVFRNEPVDFCLRVPADDTPVDVADVVKFVDSLYAHESALELTCRIREYAERHISMDAAMKQVIDYIKA